MNLAPSPFLIERSCFKGVALVGGSSFRAASLVSKSRAFPLDNFAVGLTATLFVHAQQVIQKIAIVMNAGILLLRICVPQISHKTVKLMHALQH